ncbi:non-specific lipid transfer protein GPI-anchored 14 [Lycium barbarum]|uniref:non-specific lipid transfer protein GPI-anchored 14 n=1 Tax=Lycium barbarum TaxID=112863 RepID=UPI00293F0FF8|nr:non-specific lipid transfer protein GPI-anchored 14 [Lycium barbarum]
MSSKKLLTFELYFFFFLILLLEFSRADIDKDKEECANQLVGLATCLPYASGQAKAPTPDCCTGLKEVLDKSKKCLCILVKDRDDPSLGLKINATRALSLPTLCHSPPDVANISKCLDLLHLAPNSPGAKVFQDFAKSAKGSTATPSTAVSGNSNAKPASTVANDKSNGGDRRRWMGFMEMSMGFLVIMVLSYLT